MCLAALQRVRPLRIDGILPTEAWFDEVIKKLESSDDSQTLVMLAILSQLLNAESDKADGRLKHIADETLERATTVVLEAFRRQSPVARGWLLSILDEGQISRPLVSESVAFKRTNGRNWNSLECLQQIEILLLQSKMKH